MTASTRIDERAELARKQDWRFLALVAAAALALGLLVGWFVAGAVEPDALRADGQPLTDRQQEMVDVVDDSVEAWRANDSARLLELYAPDGEARLLGSTYRVDDTRLARYVESGNWETLEVGPMLVDENRILFFHKVEGSTYESEMVFTTTGDPLVVLHTINY